jgi:hypothetical protein
MTIRERLRRQREERQTEATPESGTLEGSNASVRVASEMSGVSVPVILRAVMEGKVRSERRRGELLVLLSDVKLLATAGGSGR